MIIFEKNNKLNINFENQLDNPDIEIGKSEIKVDGNNIVNGGSGGDSGFFIVTFTFSYPQGEEVVSVDKTYAEIKAAYDAGKLIIFNTSNSMSIASYVEDGGIFDSYVTCGSGDDHVIVSLQTDEYFINSDGAYHDYWQVDL